MSCDRESVTSCQDLLAMSRTGTVLGTNRKIGLVCQLSRGPDEARSRIRRKQTAATTSSPRAGRCIVASESWAGRNCGEHLAGNQGRGGQGNLGMLGRVGRMACQDFRVSRYAQRVSMTRCQGVACLGQWGCT